MMGARSSEQKCNRGSEQRGRSREIDARAGTEASLLADKREKDDRSGNRGGRERERREKSSNEPLPS